MGMKELKTCFTRTNVAHQSAEVAQLVVEDDPGSGRKNPRAEAVSRTIRLVTGTRKFLGGRTSPAGLLTCG